MTTTTTAQQLIELIARLQTIEEMGEEFDAEDFAETLDDVIGSARQILASQKL